MENQKPTELKQVLRGDNDKVSLIINELDGRKVAYSSVTEFIVQVSRGRSSYKTKYTVVGNLPQAVMLYNGINIAAPYNKRLLMPSAAKNSVLARSKGL